MSNFSTNYLGLVKGMLDMGAKLVKMDDIYAYFEVIEGSVLDNEEQLKGSKIAFESLLGIGLKIKKVKA